MHVRPRVRLPSYCRSIKLDLQTDAGRRRSLEEEQIRNAELHVPIRDHVAGLRWEHRAVPSATCPRVGLINTHSISVNVPSAIAEEPD